VALHREYRAYLDRVKAQASEVFDLSHVARWIERNTKHPQDPDKPWSYKDHEYQIEIISDQCDEMVVKKCSQVGASEIWVRIMLGMLVLAKRITIIYVMPTRSMADNFSKGRIDPVISDSQTLRELVNGDVNSAKMKQFGRNFVYIAGSYGQSAAISVPAQALFQDEVDFCNQASLTTFNSRLGHSVAGEYYKRSFSTPTVHKFGISKLYDNSSKGHYAVKCRSCADWVAPHMLADVEVPGFNGTLALMEKEDLFDPAVKVEEAFLRCPQCRNPIPHADLCDSEKRQWIHEIPNHPIHGYQVLPIDVPVINPVPRTIRQLVDYERKKDWVNFKLGYEFEDAETAFLPEMVDKFSTFRMMPTPPDDEIPSYAQNTVFGLDVGKTSWFTVIAPDGLEGKVIYAERIRQDGENYLGARVLHLIKVFGCVKGVIDAGPDISVPKYVILNSPEGRVWACYYVRQKKGELSNVDLREDESVVNASRVGTLNLLAKRVNGGKLAVGSGGEIGLIKEHMSGIKRVDQRNDVGEQVSYWVSTGDDHYVHSLNYAQIAFDMLADGLGKSPAVACLPTISRVQMRNTSSDPHLLDHLGRRLDRTFAARRG